MTVSPSTPLSLARPSRQSLAALFTSLSRDSSGSAPRRWTLTRTLRSDNPNDINGELKGTATFTLLRAQATDGAEAGPGPRVKEMVYKEEGEMPAAAVPGRGMQMAGLRWSKRYIWRLSDGGDDNDTGSGRGSAGEDGGISVWFVKVSDKKKSTQTQTQVQEEEEETDFLFHKFEFDSVRLEDASNTTATTSTDDLVSPPEPPLPSSCSSPSSSGTTRKVQTTILTARGNHLCINDLYRTAYAFRVRTDTGEVVSWTSRHVVRGPRKNQDIVNVYT